MTGVRFAIVLVAALLALGFAVERELSTQRNLHTVAYATSAECTRCHPDHAASFARTFHRTMTQAATRESVRGPFAGETLDYFGVRAHMERGANGEFVVRYALRDGERRWVVEKTIGSRRVQQLVAREQNGALLRLPVAFDLEAGRWFHMNGAFLTADPEEPLAPSDYERHLTRWNDNCVFCHNVSPNPGRSLHGDRERFETVVTEHGVACEACHGPGAEHASVNANLLRRYRLHASDTADPTIVNPARLSPERASDVCGRCHGQRLTDDVDRFLREGDPFVPGEDLALYSAPLWRDTTLRGEPGVFADRFWPDGTPRLTAYEYQGLIMSACAAKGALTCITCHGMHEGDPRGQVRPARAGAALCVDCHDELRDVEAQARHAFHPVDRPPSCQSCHMPEIVFGVISAHPSHRIERPDPARAAREGRPDACTLCHLDKSRAWASESLRLRAPASERHAGFSEVESQLFAGDPIERALAAHALEKASSARHVALLLNVMADDPYPAVRRIAARSLGVVTRRGFEDFVPEATPGQRKARVAAYERALGAPAVDLDTIARLRETSASRAIQIGE